MIHSLDLPENCRFSGQLFGPEHAEELSEDVLLVGVGEYSIDVGWHPQYAASGRYVVRLIRDKNWSFPVEKFETLDPQIVKQYVENTAKRLEDER